ncbi:ABC transporter permease [Companilactobacillus sp.]|uniref:ABC transporter permease n=1 Tax=Companilactobacillus sp. TaxID=2767905 RepID=UPI0026057F86|nr:ABC transporter permease [Companilactobacillus sp.]
MNVSTRKVFAISQMKFKSFLSNMSLMSAPLIAVALVLMYKFIMPDVNGVNLTKTTFMLNFGVGFNTIMGGIMMGSYPIAEEKEKNTLRVLLTSSVNAKEYLLGCILPSLLIITIINIIMIPLCGLKITEINFIGYLLVTILAAFISLTIGYLIGLLSKSQMQAGLIAMPFMLILLIIPFMRMVSKPLDWISTYLYSGTLTKFINSLAHPIAFAWNLTDTIVIVDWLIVSIAAFMFVYKKHGLD